MAELKDRRFSTVLQSEEIIIPSMIGFDHDEFRSMLREEFTFYGYERAEIVFKLYGVNLARLDGLMDRGYEFTFDEFRQFNKLFNFY